MSREFNLRGLDYVVEVQFSKSFGGYEPMAAFNVLSVAEAYCGQCQAEHLVSHYRVRDLTVEA